MYLRGLLIGLSLASFIVAQDPPSPNPPAPAPTSSETIASESPAPGPAKEAIPRPVVPDSAEFVVPTGTKVPLSMINSVSTKTAAEGDRIYLETVFPILANGHVAIPPGSYVAGTVTEIKRPGRVKGRGELYVRFDSLTLPNGVTRDFRARVGSLDGRASESLDKNEGKIKSEGNKAGDVKTVGETAGAGATIGGLAGAAAGHAGLGAGIGAAAGVTAGLIGVLLTRGPEAVLAKGTTMDMVLDRPLQFNTTELDFTNSMTRTYPSDGPGPLPSTKSQSYPNHHYPL
jgi:type IV secretion system protein VirB10